jgi:hypothetical protein
LECLVINSELNASVGATYANSRQLLHNWQYNNDASIHTTNNFKKLINPKIQKTFIMGHDRSGSYATHVGNAEIKQHRRVYILTNIHYVLQFSNLISSQRLPQDGNIHYRGKNTRLEIDGKIIFEFYDEKGKHFIDEDKEIFSLQVDKDWYERYSHIPLKLFSQIDEALAGISKQKISCDACAKGKSTKAASPKQT